MAQYGLCQRRECLNITKEKLRILLEAMGGDAISGSGVRSLEQRAAGDRSGDDENELREKHCENNIPEDQLCDSQGTPSLQPLSKSHACAAARRDDTQREECTAK